MPDVMNQLVDDLVAEQSHLDAAVVGLPDASWELLTPAPGWLVRDCIRCRRSNWRRVTLRSSNWSNAGAGLGPNLPQPVSNSSQGRACPGRPGLR